MQNFKIKEKGHISIVNNIRLLAKNFGKLEENFMAEKIYFRFAEGINRLYFIKKVAYLSLFIVNKVLS